MTLAIILALLAAVGWGTSAVLVRVGLQNISSTTGTVISLASGTLLIGTIALLVNGGNAFLVPAVGLGWIALLGLINYPLGRFLNFYGQSLAGVSRTSPLLAAAPLVSVTLGVLLGGESLNLFIGLGAISIFGGIVLIVTERAR